MSGAGLSGAERATAGQGQLRGRSYLEKLLVVGAVLAGLGIGALGAPLQLPEAGGRVKVADIQLGEVKLWKVSAELLLLGPHTLRRQEGGRLVRAELG